MPRTSDDSVGKIKIGIIIAQCCMDNKYKINSFYNTSGDAATSNKTCLKTLERSVVVKIVSKVCAKGLFNNS